MYYIAYIYIFPHSLENYGQAVSQGYIILFLSRMYNNIHITSIEKLLLFHYYLLLNCVTTKFHLIMFLIRFYCVCPTMSMGMYVLFYLGGV